VWYSLITEDRPGADAQTTLDDASVRHPGSVEFRIAPATGALDVTTIACDAPAGAVGKA
jgi:hypothetical protein